MRFAHIWATFVALCFLAEAWPWPPNFGGVDAVAQRWIYKRQDDSNQAKPSDPPSDQNKDQTSDQDKAQQSEPQPSDKPADEGGSKSDSGKDSGDSSAKKGENSSASEGDSKKGEPTAAASENPESETTAKPSESDSDKEKESPTKTKPSRTKSKTFDARLPPGGISMVIPAATADPEYYKVGDHVTFAWNYTSLKVTPSAVDILAYCNTNSATYTIKENEAVDATQTVVWDTKEYQSTASQELIVATYTLIVLDSNSSVSATPQAGYLGVANQFTFGMYMPLPYVDLSQYECASCSGALSTFERQSLGFICSMAFITVLSFTWFANGFGVF